MNDQLLKNSFDQLLNDLKLFVSEEVTRQLKNQGKILEQENWIKNSSVTSNVNQVSSEPVVSDEPPMFHTKPLDSGVAPQNNTVPVEESFVQDDLPIQVGSTTRNMAWQVLDRIKARKLSSN